MFELPTLDGDPSSVVVPNAINSSRQVVGYAWRNGNSEERAFLYENGVIKDLGTHGQRLLFVKGQALPELLTDSRNAGKILFQTTIRLVDSRYQNRLHAEAYVARKGFLGDLNYGAGTLEFNNRLALSSGTKANSLNWTIKAGTSRGRLPVEEYFILGLDTAASHVLRGHTASKHGRYGSGPMGTDFALVNTEFEHRLAVLPLFNLANLPYVEIKAEVFVDAAKTFDRARLFKQGKLLVDAGAGLKLQTPTRSLNLTYGRSLREGSSVFYASIEKRW